MMVGTSNFGAPVLSDVKATIFCTDSMMTWNDARDMMTDRMTMAMGSSLRLPEKQHKYGGLAFKTLAPNSSLAKTEKNLPWAISPQTTDTSLAKTEKPIVHHLTTNHWHQTAAWQRQRKAYCVPSHHETHFLREPFSQAKMFRLSTGCMEQNTWLSWDGCKSCPAWLQCRAECSLYSTGSKAGRWCVWSNNGIRLVSQVWFRS